MLLVIMYAAAVYHHATVPDLSRQTVVTEESKVLLGYEKRDRVMKRQTLLLHITT